MAISEIVPVHGETLRLRADSWMPYNGDSNSNTPGYAIEVARTIFEPHGISIDYANLPWGDALKAVAAGEIEAVVGANRTEAEGLVLPRECIGIPRIGLYARKSNAVRYNNIASLYSVRLGVVVDYKYWPTLDQYIAKQDADHIMKFSSDKPLDDAIKQLSEGAIDVLAETASVFAWTLKSSGRDAADFRVVYLHEGDPVYFAFTAHGEQGARYARIFDDGMRAMRESGQLATILARYNQSDWANR